ncbi:hypothetical protein MMC30_000033 [Trapelia coarctata]|nr:hypothetical protein [Trapelia coarctata]
MSFLSLPPEVRQEIYYACLATITFSTLHQILPLILVNKAIRAEVTPIFDNHELAFPTINHLYAFLLAIGGHRRAALRRLSFCYAPSSGPAVGQVKWEDIELAARALKLLSRQCRTLVRLTVVVDEQDTRRYFNLGWNDLGRYKDEAQEKCDVGTTCAIRELARVRSVKEVRFMPKEGSEFTEDAEAIFGMLKETMMSQRIMNVKQEERHPPAKITESPCGSSEMFSQAGIPGPRWAVWKH